MEFWNEHEDRFVWDLLPFTFMYDCFTAWFRKTNPSGIVISQRKFVDGLLSVVAKSGQWQCDGRQKQIHTGKKMQDPELLIFEYDLIDWKHPSYTGLDPYKKSVTLAAVQYRGVTRIPGSTTAGTGSAMAGDIDLAA